MLLLTACSGQQEKEVIALAPALSAPPTIRPNESPTATIHAFLTWYEQHQTHLNSLLVVPAALDTDTTQAYAVDFQAVDQYLRLLQSSGTVSPRYVQDNRRYFQQCQDSLLAHPQTDGLPEGLNFDRVLYTQAGEAQTQFILRSKPTRVTVQTDTAQVLYRWQENEMSDGRNLAFSLAREQGRWMITAIRPIN